MQHPVKQGVMGCIWLAMYRILQRSFDIAGQKQKHGRPDAGCQNPSLQGGGTEHVPFSGRIYCNAC